MSVKVVNKLPQAPKPPQKPTSIFDSILKPCPFCGNKEPEIASESQGMHFEMGTGCMVRCNYLKGGCGARGGMRENKNDAITAWNARKAT